MSTALHHHGRNITKWFPQITHRQATDCGELVSTFPGEDAPPDEETDGPSRAEIGIGLGLLIIVIFIGAIAGGGTGNG